MYTGRTWWLRARQRSIVVLVLSLLVGWLVVTPPVPQPASAEGSLEVALLPAGLIPLDVNDRGEVLGRRGGQLELWSADATHTITSSFADAYLGPDGSVVYKRGSGDDVVVWLGPDDERTLAAPPGEALEIVPIIAPECEHLPDPFEFDHCWTLANVAVPLTLGRPVGNTADGVIVEHGPDETDAYASRYRPPAYGQSPIEGIHYEVYAVAPDGRVLGENMNIGLVTVSASGMELYPDPPPAPHQVQKMSSAGHLVVNDSGVYRVWHEGGYLPIPEGWTNAMAVNRDGVQLLSGRDEGVWKIGISHPELGVLDVRELLPSTGEFEELGPSLDIIDARRQTITDGCRFVVHATIAGVDRHLLVHLDGCAVGELEVAWSDAPGPDGVDLGDEFAMTATVTNRGAEAVSDLTLVGGSGLDLPDGIEIVDGPTWNAPASLAPGSSVDVSYVLEAVGVGEREVRIDVAASSGGGSLSADATSMVTVWPPVEASLTTSSGEEHTVVEVSLTNLWTEPLLDVRIDALVGEPASGLDIVSGPTGPNGEGAAGVDHELPPDETLAVTYEVALTGEPQLTAWLSFEDEETRTRFELPVSERDPLGLFVLLDATSDGDEIDVTVTVRNTSEEELTDVAFETGGDDEPGLLYDPDAYEPERRGDIEVVSGPHAELPSTLAPDEEAQTSFTLHAVDNGYVLLVARLRASTPGGDELIEQDVLEVLIDPCERDEVALMDCLVAELQWIIEFGNRLMLDTSDALDAELAAEGAALAGGGDLTPAQRAIGDHVPTLSEVLLALMPSSAQEAVQTVMEGTPILYQNRIDSFVTALSGTVQAVWTMATSYADNFVLVTPEVRNENARRLLEAAFEEGSYQAEGIGQYLDVMLTMRQGGTFDEMLDKYVDLKRANEQIAGDLIVQAEAWLDGQYGELEQFRQLAVSDPAEARRRIYALRGRVEGSVTGYAAETLVGARLLRFVDDAGVLVRSRRPTDQGSPPDEPGKPKRQTSAGDPPEPGGGSDGAGGSGGSGGPPKGGDRPRRVEDLSPGELSVAALAELLNGHPAEVQEAFHEVIASMEDDFGITLEVQARTAEREGLERVLAGDALAKEQWNKAKSVNFIDTTYLGAPPDLLGTAAFYPPQPDWAKINALPMNDPVRALVDSRIATQVKMWKDWSGETLDPRTGEVLSVAEQPSGTRRMYEQALTTEGYEFRNEMRTGAPVLDTDGKPVRLPDADGTILREQVAVQTKQVTLDRMEEVDLGGGRRAFVPVDRATGLPFGADVDIFALLDASVDPPRPFSAAQRSQLELEFQHRLRKSVIPFGEHGWTHSAFDLTSDLSHVRMQELYRVRDPKEARAMVAEHPAAFGLGSNPTPDQLRAMQDKVGAGEFVVSYRRSTRAVGYGALPRLRLR